MTSPQPRSRGAALARPLAFTLLMLYGLLSFLVGYQDLRLHRLATGLPYVLILCGVLMGSAAIRLLLRRRRAFGQALIVLVVLLILDLFTPIVPDGPRGWEIWLARAALSAAILWLVHRADAALPPAAPRGHRPGARIDRENADREIP